MKNVNGSSSSTAQNAAMRINKEGTEIDSTW